MSALALVVSGFTAYQVMNLKSSNALNASSNAVSVPSAPVSQTPAPNNSFQTVNPPAAAPTTAAAAIAPGQFVKPAFGTSAEVELLSVKRIRDPQTERPEIVNVQFRLRRLSHDLPSGFPTLSATSTSARNPETSETYDIAEFDRATSSIALTTIQPGASVDGYVWLRIPEGVSTIDLFLENTQAFQNVPIAN
ncbi:hypothetical protein H6F67_22070 [Microcoleus sp. FACHB-1515]|nr:hypothetical protein [Microcoleus sp. FACHB-1515]